MSDDMDLVRGSGNVFRDLGLPNPDLEQLRSLLAAEIIKALDARAPSMEAAAEMAGLAAADVARIRSVQLDRFTVDRLMVTLGRLDRDVDVTVVVRPRAAEPAPIGTAHP